MVTLILFILAAVFAGIHALYGWRASPPYPAYAPHFGWLALCLMAVAFALMGGRV